MKCGVCGNNTTNQACEVCGSPVLSAPLVSEADIAQYRKECALRNELYEARKAARAEKIYRISFNFKETGPYTIVQLQQKIAYGEVTKGYYIHPEGFSEWKPIGETPELETAFFLKEWMLKAEAAERRVKELEARLAQAQAAITKLTLEKEAAERTKAPAAAAPTAGGRTVYTIGSAGPGGGIVFYDKGNSDGGWRYLEAAPASAEFMATWEEAVRRCKEMRINGVGGWRLPDKDELNLIYGNLKKKGLGGFTDEWYWSSSEGDYHNAWYQIFSDGFQYNVDKYFEGQVRAVRAF